MANERFVRFTPKQDNVNQIISADHINQLQDVSETTQKNVFLSQDTDFLDKALFVLEHHRQLNGLWVDLLQNIDKIDLAKTQGVVYSEAESAIVFPDGSEDTDAYIYSQTYVNPNGSNMKKAMVIAHADVPTNTDIIFEISNNGSDYFEVTPSDSDPFEIPTDGQRLKLRARLIRSNLTATPRLNAWGILFRDPQLDIIEMPDGSKVVIGDPSNRDEYDEIISIKHAQLLEIGPDDHHAQLHAHDGSDGSGLVSHTVLTDIGEDDHHPKDHVHGEDGVSPINLGNDVTGTLATEHLSYYVWTGKPGTTGMFFDPSLGDRLVYVKTPDDETYLFYDLVNDRLSHTLTILQGVAVWEDMLYGDYINSSNQTVTVMKGTEKKHYDATDAMIIQEIQSMTAPSAPQNVLVTDLAIGNTLNLSWDANAEYDLVGYNVYMRLAGSISWSLANTSGLITGTTLQLTGLINGANYQFHVTAVDASAYESEDSVIVTGSPS